jgi:hypothetical protein
VAEPLVDPLADPLPEEPVPVPVPVEDPVPPLAVAPVPVPGVLPPEPPWVIEPPVVEPVPALPLLPVPGLVELLLEPDVVPDCIDPDVLAPEPVPGLFVPDATSGQFFDPVAPLPLPLPVGDVCCAPAVSAIVTKAHVNAEVTSRFMSTPFLHAERGLESEAGGASTMPDTSPPRCGAATMRPRLGDHVQCGSRHGAARGVHQTRRHRGAGAPDGAPVRHGATSRASRAKTRRRASCAA